MSEKKRTVVVLGMHRAGTSVATRLLSYLGASLPATLLKPDQDNVLGYWESLPLNDFHEDLLSSAGSCWYDIKRFPESWYALDAASEFKNRALTVLQAEYGDSSLFVLKDPRVCRIVPFWLDVLETFGAEPLFAIALRNPLEVAASLQVRDGLSKAHSLLLWLQHTLEAERQTRGHRRTCFFYEDLLDRPTDVLAATASELGLELPPLFSASRSEIDGFVSRQHRHHFFSEGDLNSHEDVSRWVKRTFAALRHLKNEAELTAELDLVWAEYEVAHRVFAPVVTNAALSNPPPHLQSHFEGWVRRVDESERASQGLITALQRELKSNHDLLVTQVKETRADYQRRIEEARQEIDRLSREVAERDRDARQTQGELETLRAEVETQSSELQHLVKELSARDETIDRIRDEAADREARAGVELQHLLGQFTLLRSQHETREENSRSSVHKALGRIASLFVRARERFDPQYYVARYRDVAESKWDPWMHYLLFGRKEQRRPGPDDRSFVRHLELRVVAESGLFSEEYYATHNPDVIQAGRDPLEHFLDTGAWEGRKPSEGFDPNYYLRTYPDVEPTRLNPLAHYLWLGSIGGRRPTPLPQAPSRKSVAYGEVTSEEGVPEPEMHFQLAESDINLIAFYLPQFHPFPENDDFWGKGFTEWTNTTRARPLFEGHDQPRRPGELGFYDLRVKEIQRRQIELAKMYGIHGFCYHYYWFDGKPVMDGPLQRLLENQDLDFPFCLHWANEPWTASWDGYHKSRVLLDQNHSPEDDISFIRHIERALHDERYIRVRGRPLLAVYRPGLFPDIRSTVDRWREHCVRSGVGEPYMVVTQQSFDGRVDPSDYGFDAALEFPPHNLPVPDVRDRVKLYDSDFEGFIGDYAAVKQASLTRPVPTYKLFRGIMPGFDCTARRKNASIFIENTPDSYQEWLEGLCRYTRANLPRDERFIFLNAWNEWAEGAYLEPDQSHGYAFLNRTARAVRKYSKEAYSRRILFIGHDAARAGAQMMLLDMIEWIARRTSTEVVLLVGKGGELLHRYQELAEVLVLEDSGSLQLSAAERKQQVREFVGDHVDLIYINTVAAAELLPLFDSLKAPIITHVHELERSIQRFTSGQAMKELVRRSSKFIAASPPVADNLSRNHDVDPDRIETINSFIQPQDTSDAERQRSAMRKRLELGPDHVAVFGCGTRDWRKGPDLFVDVAALLAKEGLSGFRFFWIGGEIDGDYENLEASVEGRNLEPYVSFLGPQQSPRDYFRAGDIFLLPSREDPFPLVCLEAADCGLPIICFASAGGMPDFVEDDAGFVVPHEDVAAMAAAVARLIRDSEERRIRGETARQKLNERHVVEIGMPEIFQIVRTVAQSPPLVSVIIPSYNYDQYLKGRLTSIFRQTFQDFEIIVEDDCSTDNTLSILSTYHSHRNLRVETHSRNQGTFAMWAEGLKAASGSIIWIAEEDDLCEPTFLEKLIPLFDDTRVTVAYCQSSVINERGSVSGDYTLCFPDISESKWLQPYVQTGEREIKEGLAVKNFILNSSSVLFRKPNIQKACMILKQYRLSGDWALYLYMLKDGYIAYSPEHLNNHRRHNASVVGKLANTNVPIEEASRIHSFAIEHYDVDEDLKHRMADYAFHLWQERNPDMPSNDFWKVYQVDHSADTRTSVAASGSMQRQAGS